MFPMHENLFLHAELTHLLCMPDIRKQWCLGLRDTFLLHSYRITTFLFLTSLLIQLSRVSKVASRVELAVCYLFIYI